jgi:Zn-dependent peptidase ImmA (M78 family)
LWHILFQDDPLFLVTAAYTDRQKVERAFAAELLAPAQGVAERLGNDGVAVTSEDIEAVAQHFDVSAMVIQHQVENQLSLPVVA